MARLSRSVVVIGQLYQHGLVAGRERINYLADLIWDDRELRTTARSHRRYTPEQINVLRCVIELTDRFTVPLDDIVSSIDERGLKEGLEAMVHAKRRQLNALKAAVDAIDAGRVAFTHRQMTA